MSKRKYEPGAFVPCSSKHKSCSPAHASSLAGYRAERERQEKLFEAETGNYAGDIKWHKENGHQLITFKKWLKHHRISTETRTMNESNKGVKHVDGNCQKPTEDQNFAQMNVNQVTQELGERIMQQNEVDQIFNQMTQEFGEKQPETCKEEFKNEEECNCDCDVCCRNDHIACEHDCESGPEYVQRIAGNQ